METLPFPAIIARKGLRNKEVERVEARADFSKILRANLERAVEAAKEMPEIDKAYFAGQIAGMLAGRNMAAQKEEEPQQKNAG